MSSLGVRLRTWLPRSAARVRARLRARRAGRRDLRRSGSVIRGGIWKGGGGVYWADRSDLARVDRMFLRFYRSTRPFWHSLPYFFAIRRPAPWWSRRARTGATVVFASRNGSVKCFDFRAMTITTRVSGSMMRTLLRARSIALFSFFETPAFTAKGAGEDAFLKQERLFELPCVGLQTERSQHLITLQIAKTYTRYVVATGRDPDPQRFLTCFDEVRDCLSPSQRSQLDTTRASFVEFINTARLVESHLDFNVANFIGGGDRPLLLVDIADAGLLLPATYDMNNLLLNEVYRGRSTHLLRSALASPESLGLTDVLSATTGRSTLDDVRSSMVANFVLRESRLVALPLLGRWSPEQVRASWHGFAEHVPGWPFAGPTPEESDAPAEPVTWQLGRLAK